MSPRITVAFWVCFVTFPIISGAFHRPGGSDEFFDSNRHVVVTEAPRLDQKDDVVMVPEMWQDKTTGAIHSYSEFRGRRVWRAFWNTIKMTLLVVAGTCFHLTATRHYDRRQVYLVGSLFWLTFTVLLWVYM